MIAIVDYGLGNIKAFANLYKTLDVPYRVARRPEELLDADRLILPGVGAFDGAMELLNRSGFRETLDELVLKRGVPVLGICVGMQILARSSEEGRLPGLGWIDGEVRRFEEVRDGSPVRLPHMGWNDIRIRRGNALTEGLPAGARCYFLHSYYFVCDRDEDAIADADYGGSFSCAVNARNIYGVQFHPEKSHSNGILMLRNFGTFQAC